MKFNTPDNRDPRWGPEVDAAIALKVAQAVSKASARPAAREGKPKAPKGGKGGGTPAAEQ